MGLLSSILDKLYHKDTNVTPPGMGVGTGSFIDDPVPQRDYPIVPAHGQGIDGWSPHVGVELPTKADQDSLLVHYDMDLPNAAKPDHGPTAFWEWRNRDTIANKWPQQTLVGKEGWPVETRAYHAAPDPKATPVIPDRVTSNQSPSNYRFTAPMRSGQGDTALLSSPPTFTKAMVRYAEEGNHFSMASHHRAYPIMGMTPVNPRRNTFRLEPAGIDASVPPDTQISETGGPLPQSAGRSWRLT